jgi:hypothetical protein
MKTAMARQHSTPPIPISFRNCANFSMNYARDASEPTEPSKRNGAAKTNMWMFT